jgi:long-chain acyl-CoA synthetase
MEERIWHKAYAQGVPPSIDYEKITMPEALERTVRNFPDNTALVMMGKKISYQKLDELVNRFAAALAALGIQKGDKVAILLPNLPQGFVAAQAVFKLGGVVVMHNPLYTETELAYQLNDSDSKMAISLDLLGDGHCLPHSRLPPLPQKAALSLRQKGHAPEDGSQ